MNSFIANSARDKRTNDFYKKIMVIIYNHYFILFYKINLKIYRDGSIVMKYIRDRIRIDLAHTYI